MVKLDLSFGTLIAYLMPGIVGLYSIVPFSPTIKTLLFSKNGVPETASIFIILLISLMIGMIINAIGFVTIRKLFQYMGIKPPSADDYSKLTQDKLPVLERITGYTYKYFECYCNLAVSIAMLITSKIIVKFKIIEGNEDLFIISGLILVFVILLLVAYYSYHVYSVRMRKLFQDESFSEKLLKGGNMSIGEGPK